MTYMTYLENTKKIGENIREPQWKFITFVSEIKCDCVSQEDEEGAPSAVRKIFQVHQKFLPAQGVKFGRNDIDSTN